MLYVHEREDETVVVARVSLEGRALPRSLGELTALGRCEVDEARLSRWVCARLEEEGYAAVVGRDACVVRTALAQPAPVGVPGLALHQIRPAARP